MHETSSLERQFLFAVASCIALGIAALAVWAAPQIPTAPRFGYGPGAQGYGYHPAPQAVAAPRQTTGSTTSSRPRTVGPGVRNWATGNRVPLHRPWMQARS